MNSTVTLEYLIFRAPWSVTRPLLAPLALTVLLAAGCAENSDESPAFSRSESASEIVPASPIEAPAAPAASAVVADAASLLADDLTICAVPDPQVPSSAFEIFNAPPDETGDYWVRYTCKQACEDWRQCHVPAHAADQGEPIMHGRSADQPKQALAFVIDGMGGHLVFTEDGEKTVIIHTGAGGTRYYANVAAEIEKQSAARTVLVRWEKGFVGNVVRPPFLEPVQWGWYSRTSAEGTTLRALNRRVAGVIAWTHAHLAGDYLFGTMGCSMGTNATFMPVLWHGLEPIIDYQLFVGGPNMWDLNAQCGLRQYTRGYCDLDGVTPCETTADCAAAGPGAQCRMPQPYTEINVVFDQFANHVHAATACDILAADAAAEPYPPFDDSSMGFVEMADWNIDHRVDFLVDVGLDFGATGSGGDEYWALGDFMYVYNKIQPAENRQWHAYSGANHCESMTSGAAADLVIERMDL